MRIMALATILSLGMVAAVGGPAAACADAPASHSEMRDGSHDFDFNFGKWRTHLKRLREPLSGSSEWIEYEGTSIVHDFLGGRASLVELSVAGAAGRIEGVMLRLYRPDTRQWHLHYASIRNGEMTPPLVGAFTKGRGEFYGDDTLGGRPIRVRFVISGITANSATFEQAFSADGGKTWEVNWIATDTRL
jgi:hypothetical protein